MCIVISGENQPDTTKLINIPIKIHGESTKYNFFIYVNNFDLFNNNQNMEHNNFNDSPYENYASYEPINNFSSYQTKNNSIMVVPFPVEKGTKPDNIGLVDVSTKSMKELRDKIKALKPKLKSSRGGFDMFLNCSNSSPLEVHKIGNYNISVALSLNQLLNRIDWTRFNKPRDFNQRVQTFNNEKLYPSNFDYFYVVAEATENIKDDGFGIVYPQLNNFQYIPTAHEDTEQTPEFDVEIYNFGYNDSIKDIDFKNVLRNINGQPVKMINNTYKNMLYDDNIKSFNFKKEKDRMVNHNIWLVK